MYIPKFTEESNIEFEVNKLFDPIIKNLQLALKLLKNDKYISEAHLGIDKSFLIRMNSIGKKFSEIFNFYKNVVSKRENKKYAMTCIRSKLIGSNSELTSASSYKEANNILSLLNEMIYLEKDELDERIFKNTIRDFLTEISLFNKNCDSFKCSELKIKKETIKNLLK